MAASVLLLLLGLGPCLASVDFTFYLLTEEQWNAGNLVTAFQNALHNVSHSVCAADPVKCGGQSFIPASNFSIGKVTYESRFLKVAVTVAAPATDAALQKIGSSGRQQVSSFLGGWTVVGVGKEVFSPAPDHLVNAIVIAVSCSITLLLIIVTWVLSAIYAKQHIKQLAMSRRPSNVGAIPLHMNGQCEAASPLANQEAPAANDVTTEHAPVASPCHKFMMAPLSGGGSCAVAMPPKAGLLPPLSTAPPPPEPLREPPEISAAERLARDSGQRQADALQSVPDVPPVALQRQPSAMDVLGPLRGPAAARLPPMALRTLPEENGGPRAPGAEVAESEQPL